MLDHGEAKVLFTDREFSPTIAKALALAKVEAARDRRGRRAVRGRRARSARSSTRRSSPRAIPDFEWRRPPDEWDAIALNYTSGTTGNPKGVVYHYRGAYLNAVNNILDWSMPQAPGVPVDAADVPLQRLVLQLDDRRGRRAPTCACARSRRSAILDLIREHKVTHYCGAPIVHSMLLNAPAEWKRGIDHEVHCLVAAAPPPAAVIEGMAQDGLRHHARLRAHRDLRPGGGVREAPEWDALPLEEQVRAQRPPGRGLPAAGRHDGDGPGDDARRCRATARPWARSCSAATSR